VSLHAKTFSIDRSRVFVGSFNFDPRSARLNTEMGVLIDSRRRGGGFATIDTQAPLAAWETVLSADGERLEWVERTPNARSGHEYEPGTGFFKQLGVGILSWPADRGMLLIGGQQAGGGSALSAAAGKRHGSERPRAVVDRLCRVSESR